MSPHIESLATQCVAFLLMSLLCQKKAAEQDTSSLAGASISPFLSKRGGLCYLVLIVRIFPHYFLLFLNMGEFSAAGGRQLGLGVEGPASLLFVVGCTNMSRFKPLELSGESGRTQIGCSISKLKSTQCNFRCELYDVPVVAELLLEELSVGMIVSPLLGVYTYTAMSQEPEATDALQRASCILVTSLLGHLQSST